MPVLDEWIIESPLGAQRGLHERFVDTLASVHRVDWRSSDLGTVLRGGEVQLHREVAWWAGYVDWASKGTRPGAPADAIAWCAATVPRADPPPSLCWGDARIGNVLFDDARSIASVLDWELASIGPAE